MFLAKGSVTAMKEPCGWPTKKRATAVSEGGWQKTVPGC